ncbi:MAG: carboxypeptidase regulatory-like domain-containing protein [Pedosphaera sp.]|nr:carboxypeptidase regulatory-like domain-containing protein [Pedosphaera sp.]
MKIAKLALAIWLAANATAHAYVQNIVGSGATRHWELASPPGFVSTNSVNPTTHAIRYYLASDGASTTNTAAELNALRASIGQWLAITNTLLKFEEAGVINPPVDVNTGDGTNVFYWVKGTTFVNGGNDNIFGALGYTVSSYTASDGTMFEADIVFNAHTNAAGATNFWFTDFNDTANTTTFVEGVALHELGHLLGLSHSPVGGATMLFRGVSGLNTQAGLSDDDVAGGKFLYATNRTSFGAISGTVTKSGSPVFGAAVFVQNSASNVVSGTVTRSGGTYELNMLPPGSYQVRVAPLDPATGTRLVAGVDIENPGFSSADTAFLPTTNTAVTVTANSTNIVNFTVSNAPPAFRITRTRKPASSPLSYSVSSTPVTMTVGQSNYTIGIGLTNMPTNSLTLTITGDGLTLGSSIVESNIFANVILVSVPISVASNATPGLRNFIVSQSGTNVDYANAFLEIQPAVPDYNWDGLDDRFQRQYFQVFTSSNAAPTSDPDGDGMNNVGEYIAGTVPTNAASVLKMQSVSRTNNTNTVRWSSVSGKKYQAAYRTNIASGSWSNLGSVVTAAGATSLQTDTTATNAFRAYRVQVLQ